MSRAILAGETKILIGASEGAPGALISRTVHLIVRWGNAQLHHATAAGKATSTWPGGMIEKGLGIRVLERISVLGARHHLSSQGD